MKRALITLLVEWDSHIAQRLAHLVSEAEPWLQESAFITGQQDALAFLAKHLGFQKRVEALPSFEAGKRMPRLQELARKRGFNAATQAAMSERARAQVWEGNLCFILSFRFQYSAIIVGLEQLTNMVQVGERMGTVPANAKSIEWTNGFETCLPWTIGVKKEEWVCDCLHSDSCTNLRL